MKNSYGLCLCLVSIVLFVHPGDSVANPDRYPQFARPEGDTELKAEFIHVDQLVDEIINKKKPLIVDVRTEEEYKEAHIKGSVSIPLEAIQLRLAEIPKDRLVVLY